MAWLRFVSALFVALPLGAQALLRFPCSQLVSQRFDPLATPGQVSPHIHQIVGGNAFNLTMDPNNDLPALATCTTCRFKENSSNYWTAIMYFKHPNGTFLRVPQIPNHFTGVTDGGMTVYYIQPPGGQRVTAFPKGFRMITGDALSRSRGAIDPDGAEAYSLTFRCWESDYFLDPSNLSAPGAGAYDTVHLPKKNCPGGIRANIYFPSCWDGKNLDSPNHKSHVAFLEGKVPRERSIFFMEGTCPETHPVRIPMVFLETVWDTRPFSSMWPEDGSQPFVLSQGDPTGYGHHADYLFGWEGDALQRAMDKCTDIGGRPEDCKELTLQTDQEINQCKQRPQVDEVTEGQYIPALPGCNPIQEGPGRATSVRNCGAVSTTGIASPATVVYPAPTKAPAS